MKKKVLVTVKAYPERSTKYGQVVCTAGITDEGDWIRLYPIPLKFYSGRNKIKKYDWIEVECQKAKEKLRRKESYRVRNGSIKIVDRSLSEGKVKGKANWAGRNEYVLKNVAPSLEYLEEKFKEDRTSLGLIKPVELLDFYNKGELEIFKNNSSFQTAVWNRNTSY